MPYKQLFEENLIEECGLPSFTNPYQSIPQTEALQLTELEQIKFITAITPGELARLVETVMDETKLGLIHLYHYTALMKYSHLLSRLLEREIEFIRQTIYEECNTLLASNYRAHSSKFSFVDFGKAPNKNRSALLALQACFFDLSTLNLLLTLNEMLKNSLEKDSAFHKYLEKSFRKLQSLTLPQIKFCLLKEIKNLSNETIEVIRNTKSIEVLQAILKENKMISAALGVLLNVRNDLKQGASFSKGVTELHCQ